MAAPLSASLLQTLGGSLRRCSRLAATLGGRCAAELVVVHVMLKAR
jgi:hypothetical protein